MDCQGVEQRIYSAIAQSIPTSRNQMSQIRIHQGKVLIRFSDIAGAVLQGLGLYGNHHGYAAARRENVP